MLRCDHDRCYEKLIQLFEKPNQIDCYLSNLVSESSLELSNITDVISQKTTPTPNKTSTSGIVDKARADKQLRKVSKKCQKLCKHSIVSHKPLRSKDLLQMLVETIEEIKME